ncbi:MAG TPA: choice-of-anchor tandem repeat GloVer-containing protein [Terracidiphilus sp.]|nr:choice-of-anchor tandem repeat GloVer-containing protein [Terracidiphilus sp.]
MSLRLRRLLEHLTSAILLTAFALAVRASAAPKEKVLHSFSCTPDACVPQATVVLDRNGHLYGTTSGGGTGGAGTVYEVALGSHSSTETVIYSFTGSGGYTPYAPLIVDPAGNLFGTATSGGTHDDGTAFELSPGSNGWTIDVLHSFDLTYHGSDGSSPWAGLVMDETGNLYGLTREGGIYGGGIAFELTPGSNGWTETILYSFCAKFGEFCYDGSEPYFAPVLDDSGNVYGTTWAGGSDNLGTVFEISPVAGGGWKERVLHSFGGIDGAQPYGGLVFDAAGNLYGTTQGGPTGQGTVFKLTPGPHGRWRQTILYTFPHIQDGVYPQGTMARDKAGALYGIAGGGNDCGGVACGVVYKLAPQTHGKWKYSVLYKFNGPDGIWPQGGVILDKQERHLYGATESGGAYGYGVVFEITP